MKKHLEMHNILKNTLPCPKHLQLAMVFWSIRIKICLIMNQKKDSQDPRLLIKIYNILACILNPFKNWINIF